MRHERSAALLSMAVGLVALILLSWSPFPARATGPANQIDFVAGGYAGNGDGGAATDAGLQTLSGVAVDGSGAVYVSEWESCRIRKVVGGAISTFAGTGTCGTGAEAVAATASDLYTPDGLDVDSAGNVYVADRSNCRIRKIDTLGIITTVVALTFCSDGGEGGPAIDARLSSPKDVAVDAVTGDLYIADTANCKVKRVSGGIITTIAGTGACGYNGEGTASSATLNYPSGVSSDGAGNVYIADTYNYRIRKVTGGVISTVAGSGVFGSSGDGGAATSAQIGNAQDIYVSGGALYLPDENCRVRRVLTGTITTVAGTGTCGYGGDGGPATAANIPHAYGVHATADGDLYIAGGYGVPPICQVRKVTAGTITTIAGAGTCGVPNDQGVPSAAVMSPVDVAVDGSNNVFIADEGLCRVRKLTGSVLSFYTAAQQAAPYTCPDTEEGGSVASAGMHPTAIAAGAGGDVFVASDCRIRKISGGIVTTIAGTGACGLTGNGGPALAAQVDYAKAIALDATGANVYFIQGCSVRRINAGTITAFAGTGTCYYNGLGGVATSVHLYEPGGLAVGPDGTVYISDTRNCLIRKVKNGQMSHVAGQPPVDMPPFPSCGSAGDGLPITSGSVRYPGPLVVDGNQNIFFTEGTGSCRVRIIANGYMNTIANTSGACAYAGDGGAATTATLDEPEALALRSDGDLYVAGGGRVRVIHATDFDLDGDLDGADNCVFIVNAGQANADANFISNAPIYATNDLTRAQSDPFGDECDSDDDNDGYGDFLESNIAPGDSSHLAWCPGASADTDSQLLDTDGDRVTDAAECGLGSDPAAASSVPLPIVQPDADNDGAPDFYDPNDSDTDSDDDGILDRLEFRNYGTALNALDSDGDGVKDGCEVASLNTDAIVNSGDQGMLAAELMRMVPQSSKLVNFDITKDSLINSGDQGLMASRIGKCP